MITFDSQQQVFNLSNSKISYLFSIEEGGLLSHLYYGPRIRHYHGERRYPRIDRGFSGNLPHSKDRTYSKDDLLQEYSGNNTGDYRLPAITVKGSDGARFTDFRYDSYRIIDGKPALPGLPSSYVKDNDEAQTLEVNLKDATLKLTLTLVYSIYKDRAVVTRNARLQNNSNQPIDIEKIASMQLDLTKHDYDLVYLPGQYALERQTRRVALNQGIFEISSRRDSSSHHMNPFAALVDKDTDEFHGNALGVLLVYSGNHKISIERDQIDQTRLIAGINDFNFSWHLEPGESFQTPEAITVFSTKGLNGMSQIFHHLLRERVARGKFQYADRPIVINNWEATFFDFNDQKLDEVVKEAKPLGIEMFVLDDGWFGHRNDDNSSLGDWFVNKDKVNLKRVAKQTHDAGMKFGLWFEPEMISVDSDLYRKHPDWALAEPGRGSTLSRNQLVLDFSRPEVVDNIFQQMCKILDAVSIDYIKWDCNRNLTEVYSQAVSPDHEGEIAHREILGVYSLMDRLTKRYPNILFEGCSGGGGRFDAGILYYMPQSWPSDDTDAAERLKIQDGTSLVYPISSMSAHVSVSPNQQTGRSISFKTRGDVAMAGVFGYELDLAKLTDDEKQQVKKQIAFYKQHRHLIQYGDFYRLESPFTSNTVAWEFVSPDKSEALLFMFRQQHTNRMEIVNTKMVALDPQRDYSDMTSDQVFGGDELMNVGLYRDPKHVGDYLSEVHYFKEV
ncbi:alpha-galactosidase [Limosilactobacillus sp.]|uniref:alpha-galactosidase n=1 Tax=Limosilactobacillus sp. TaxID=2773925 RepID=UPI00345EE547